MAETEKKSTRPDKSDLVNEVMNRFGIPSWEAWEMTEPELTKKLES